MDEGRRQEVVDCAEGRSEVAGVLSTDPHSRLQQSVLSSVLLSTFPEIVIGDDLLKNRDCVRADALHSAHNIKECLTNALSDVDMADIRNVDQHRNHPLKVGHVAVHVVRDNVK